MVGFSGFFKSDFWLMIIAVVIVVSLIGITIVIAFMVLSLEVMQILEMTNMTKQVLVNGEYY